MSYIEPSANVTQLVTNAGGAPSATADLDSVIIGPAYNVLHAGSARSQVLQIAAITDPDAPVEYTSAAGGYVFEDHIPQSTTAQGETDPVPGHFQMLLPGTLPGQVTQAGEFDLTLVNAQVRQNVLVATGVDPDILATVPGNQVDQSGLADNVYAGFIPLSIQGQPLPMDSTWLEVNPATQVAPVFTRNGVSTQLGLVDKGSYDASGNAYPGGTINTGDYWTVSVPGTVAPFITAKVLIALVNSATQSDADWEVITVVANGSAYRGSFDATGNTYPGAATGSAIDNGGNISIKAGDAWKISVPGSIAPFNTAVGLVALVDAPTLAGEWEATTWDPSLKYAYAPDVNGYDSTASTLVGDILKYSVLHATADVTVSLRVHTVPSNPAYTGAINDRGDFDAGVKDGYPGATSGSGLAGAIVAGDFYNVTNATSLSPLYGAGGVYALVNGASEPADWATTSVGLLSSRADYDLDNVLNTGYPLAATGSGGGSIVAGDWYVITNDGPSHSGHPLHGATVAIAKQNNPGQSAGKWILLTIPVQHRPDFDAGLAANTEYPITGGSGTAGAIVVGDYFHVTNAEAGSPLLGVTGLIAIASPPTSAADWLEATEEVAGIEVTAVDVPGTWTVDSAPKTYTTTLRAAQESLAGIWTVQTSGRLVPDAYQTLKTPGVASSVDFSTPGDHFYTVSNIYEVYNALPIHFNPAGVENILVDVDVYRVHSTLTIPLDQTPSDADMPWIYFQDAQGVMQREPDTTTNPADGQAVLDQSTNYLNTLFADSAGYVTIPANFKSAARPGSNGITILYGEISTLPLPSDWNLSIIRFAEAVFLGYRALRTDLTDQLLTLTSSTDVVSQLGEDTPDNPLALATRIALGAAGGVPIKAYATVSNDTDGHLAAMEYLERRTDVHCLAPLTRDTGIITTYATHVKNLSTNLENAWRTCIFNAAHPDKQLLAGGDRTDTLAAGSVYQTAAPNGVGIPQYNASSYTTRLVDTTRDFLALGVKASDEVTIPTFRLEGSQTLPSGTVPSSFAGDWVVDSIVDSHTLVIKPAGGTYPKSYYSNTANRPTNVVPLSSSSFVPYYVHRAATKDYVVQYLKSLSTVLKSNRMIHAQPDVIEVEVSGSPQLVDGMYFCAEHAGILAGSRPQQNFTRMATAGITDLQHSNFYFTRSQMRDLASAGIMLAVQKVPQGIPFVSHALTTDMTATFFQEQMKIRNLDFLSYTFLNMLDPFIGKWNIVTGLFTTARTIILGKAAQLKSQNDTVIGPPLLDLKIVTLAQSTLNADRVTVHLKVAIVDPANYIDIILEV